MIARSVLAFALCPGLGILAGGWLGQQVTSLSRAAASADADSGGGLIGGDLLYGAAAGCAVGLFFAIALIWCAKRGPQSAQRALADLLLIALGLLFIVDWVTYVGLVPDAAELWAKLLPVNAGMWLLGLALSVVAMRKVMRGRHVVEAEA
ncbi:MAG: hypothetical protein PVH68_09255 [Armatimonadota bacterium]|jgi:hypothetical protein